MTFKQQIIALRMSEPSLNYRQIAERIGCSRETVRNVCQMSGLGIGPPLKDWKPDYIRVRRDHPGWSVHQLAKYLGAHKSTIWRLERDHNPNLQSVQLLGQAAARAGLTVAQIEAMANARNA